MLAICIKSLLNRRFVAALTILSIAMSVALILGVERLRTEARAGFANSASGIDLIVAARGNDVQILMATVFGVGSTGAGIDWDSYEMVEDMPQVSWAVPIMMGDNHRGYPVIGTSEDYFEHFRHSRGKSLGFRNGVAFSDATGAVIGADVAQAFGYELGAEIVNAHGSGEVAFDVHDDDPFIISGILEPTGTAIDRMVLVSLEGFDALHEEEAETHSDPFAEAAETDAEDHDGHDAHDEHEAEEHGAHVGEEHEDEEKHGHDSDDADGHDDHGHEPGIINAIYVGLTERTAVLSVQRQLSEFKGEALTAVLPSVALLQLWSLTDTAETALQLMSAAVALAGVTGLIVMLSAALDARRREFAIFRSVGATPNTIFSMIVLEAVLLLVMGIVLGYLLLIIVALAANPILAESFGLRLGLGLSSYREALLIAFIFCSGFLASFIPAFRVYRMTLADGLSMKL